MMRPASVTFRCLLLLQLLLWYSNIHAQDSAGIKKPVTADDFYAAGERYFAQKDFPKAISMLENAVRLNNRYGAAYNRLATCYLQSNEFTTPEDYKKARNYLQKALAANPVNWNPYANLIQANIYQFIARKDSSYLKEALLFSKQERQNVPEGQTGARYYVTEAALFNLTGETYMEQKALSTYLFIDSLNGLGYMEWATERYVYNLLNMGKMEEAKITLDKYAKLTSIKKYNLLLGIINYNLGDPGTALKYLDMYIERNADDPEARYYRGHCYLKQNRRTESKAEFQFCLSKQYRVQDVTNWIKETETKY